MRNRDAKRKRVEEARQQAAADKKNSEEAKRGDDPSLYRCKVIAKHILTPDP